MLGRELLAQLHVALHGEQLWLDFKSSSNSVLGTCGLRAESSLCRCVGSSGEGTVKGGGQGNLPWVRGCRCGKRSR